MEKDKEAIHGFKGFDKDLKCRDKQYKIGETFEEDANPEVCERGMHFCENPFDVFGYYPPNKFNRFCEVEGMGKVNKGKDKISCSILKLGAEIKLGGLIDAGVKFCLNRVKWSKEDTATGDYSGASATGNYSGASATGDYSGASATGDYSGASATGNCSGASATGYKSGASASKGSVALATGYKTRAKGEIGAFIVLTECEEIDSEYFIKDVKVARVDGKAIKEDVWYTLKNGEFIEANEKDY